MWEEGPRVAIPTLESCQIRRNFFDKIASDSVVSQVEDFCLSDTDKSFHAVSGNICSFKVAALYRSRVMLLDYPTRLIYCQNEVTHLPPSFSVYNHILDDRNGWLIKNESHLFPFLRNLNTV
jgi:hypothetical protein